MTIVRNLIATTAIFAAICQPFVACAAPKPVSKQVAKAVMLSMKQVTVAIEPTGDAKANADKISAFQAATLGIFSCADVAGVARSLGATVTDAPNIPITALPPALRETVRTMKIGTATQMFGDRNEGKVRVLVLCGRR